ncbi:MAG: cupin domain-containing protein [Acidobacteria bacterium]|nr:cupin domain-containing protein [Acidobacteriota bacterium]
MASDPQGYHYWASGQLKGYEKDLAAKVDPNAEIKVAGLPLASLGQYTFAISHRENSGLAELHDIENDVFIVESGEATLLVGGEMVKPRRTGKTQTVGKSIKGGIRQKLSTGDVVHIPAKMPHQLVLEPGKPFTYFVIKVMQ